MAIVKKLNYSVRLSDNTVYTVQVASGSEHDAFMTARQNAKDKKRALVFFNLIKYWLLAMHI